MHLVARVSWWRLLAGVVAVGAGSSVVGQAASAPPVTWERDARALPESIWSVEAADANGDGKPDLIAMGVTKVFALLAPDWKERVLLDTREGKMLYCVALDANRDGRLDLVLGRYQIPWIEFRLAKAQAKTAPQPQGPDFSIAWLENTGASDRPWPLHIVDRELNGIHGLCVAPPRLDGRRDVFSTSISGPFFPNSVLWFEVPAEAEKPWSRRAVTARGADGRPHYVEAADLNGDGRADVLLGDSGRGTFTWWERPARNDDAWTRHLVATEKGATNLKAADLNGDGRPDLVGACGHGQGIFWFEATAWKRHPIDSELATPHALAIADFDGDGDLDVATASYTACVVRWYENDGHGGFTPHDLDTGHQQQAYDLKVTDFDGDGRPDLILAGRESKNAVWYRNRKP